MNSSVVPLSSLALPIIGLYLGWHTRRNLHRNSKLHAITPSPLVQAWRVTDRSTLAYPPDLLPGARNVRTPFGFCRVYEFGPLDGFKVLLIHGISTPCTSVAPLARQLAKRGCRVMTFDLYGRGFSDNPTNHPHSDQLYISEVLAVLASSSLSWTGDNAISIIGYSMGGCIAAAFADCFPSLVKSLVLIAPAGIVREKNLKWQRLAMFLIEGLLPSWIIRKLIQRRLNNPMMSLNKLESDKTATTNSDVSEISEAEAADAAVKTVVDSVRWQVNNHPGFVDAFTSSVRHAPLSGQQAQWSRIGARLDLQRSRPDDREAVCDGFVGGKLVMILGNDDAVILSDEVEVDAKPLLGEENVQIYRFNAGHDLPVVMPERTANRIWQSWLDLGVVSKSS